MKWRERSHEAMVLLKENFWLESVNNYWFEESVVSPGKKSFLCCLEMTICCSVPLCSSGRHWCFVLVMILCFCTPTTSVQFTCCVLLGQENFSFCSILFEWLTLIFVLIVNIFLLVFLQETQHLQDFHHTRQAFSHTHGDHMCLASCSQSSSQSQSHCRDGASSICCHHIRNRYRMTTRCFRAGYGTSALESFHNHQKNRVEFSICRTPQAAVSWMLCTHKTMYFLL